MSDQDDAIKFYTTTLVFSLVADMPFGENNRCVEVAVETFLHDVDPVVVAASIGHVRS